jgi:hypothetical protein
MSPAPDEVTGSEGDGFGFANVAQVFRPEDLSPPILPFHRRLSDLQSIPPIPNYIKRRKSDCAQGRRNALSRRELRKKNEAALCEKHTIRRGDFTRSVLINQALGRMAMQCWLQKGRIQVPVERKLTGKSSPNPGCSRQRTRCSPTV